MGSYGLYIFSRRSDLDDLLLELDRYLELRGDKLCRTRKGRVWDLYIDDRSYHIHVEDTEIEEDLLECDLLPEDAPFTIGISSSGTGFAIWNEINALSTDIAKLSRGVATEPSM